MTDLAPPKMIMGLLCLLLPVQMLAQSLERKVFSNGGGSGTVALQDIAYTFGEPIIGTDMTNVPFLTKGFHQPIPVSVLNVESLELEVDLLNENAILHWKYDGFPYPVLFEILRSEDGNNYLTLGIKSIQDTSLAALTYEFVDPGIVFSPVQRYVYRIRAIREDGSYLFSQPVELSWSADTFSQISMYPNPARDALNLIIPAEKGMPLEVSAYNALGQRVFFRSLAAEEALVRLSMDVGDLPRGVYSLRVLVRGKMTSLSFQLYD